MGNFIQRLFIKLILILFINTSSVLAQEIEWQNTIGGSTTDDLRRVKQTTDGGYILGGYSGSDASGDKTENCNGIMDYWIVKTNYLGVVVWQNTIGAAETENLSTLIQTNDGGYLLGGSSDSYSSGDKSGNCIGGDDWWIVKTNSMGVIQWEYTIGGSLNEGVSSIEQTLDGGYIFGGSSRSNISGDKSENSIGGYDFWMVKTDSLGNFLWQNTIGGVSDDRLISLQQTSDGGYILGGSSTSDISGDKSENCLGFDDYWIIKTDTVGNIIWQKTIGGSDYDILRSIEETADGGFILGGLSRSNISGSKTEDCLGLSDYWIVKTDSVGNIVWQNTIGGDDEDYLMSITKSLEGGYILGGWSKSNISSDKSENSVGNGGKEDYWIVKVDELGNIEWQKTIGGSFQDGLNSIQQTADGGYILGGYSWSDASGDKTENCLGGYDYWIVKLTGKNNLITGQLFIDLNSNGIRDSGELPLPARKITEQNTGQFAFSQQNGNYSVPILDTGSFSVSPQLANWFSPSPTTHSASFTGINETDSLNDFAFQPQGTFEDVCITITPLGPFRSGFSASYMISYGNYGTTTVSNPIVYFYPYSNVTFQSATVTPNQIFPDSILWNLPALTPFQTGSIIVTVNVNPGLPIGTLINSSAHIEPYATDDNPSCNNSNWEVYTTGSFDPNDILVNEDTLTTTQLSNAPWLEYIIRFQNTGNDTAFTVKILNPIDTNKLNLSTFEFTNASHPVNLNWINYQRNMEFKFENILLVDSNTNEPLSHGFVRYRIQPKTTLSAGDSITNFAAIYFDFNEPVITNTAKTSIILPAGIASATPTQGKLHVFPNPSENTINISGDSIGKWESAVEVDGYLW
jgi:hypothetical protein